MNRTSSDIGVLHQFGHHLLDRLITDCFIEGCPLILPTFQVPEFRAYPYKRRVVRSVVLVGHGKVFHVVGFLVIKEQIGNALVGAALAEVWTVARRQPVTTVCDF